MSFRVPLLLLLLCGWSQVCALCYAPHHLYLGLDYSYQVQDFEASGSNRGHLWGVAGEYDYIRNCSWYVGTEVTWVKGDTQDGFRRASTDFDAQGAWGYTWFLTWDSWTGYVVPLLGIGFRQLKNELLINDDTTPEYRYNLWYVPIGFRAAYLCGCWEVGLNFQFRWTVDATRRQNSDDVRVVLARKFGFNIEVPVIWRVTPCQRCGWEFRGVPYWKWERFGSGKVAPADSQFDRHDWGLFLQFGVRV